MLSDTEKEYFAKIYQKDIAHLKISDLKEQLPNGFVELKSRTTGTQSSVVVYPFFENTCQFLTEHKIAPTKTISDYEIRFLQVMKNRRVKAKTDGSRTGGVTSELCTKPEEIKKWRDKLVPKSLDIQPLLCPMHDLSNAKAEVEDTDYQIPITVECTVR